MYLDILSDAQTFGGLSIALAGNGTERTLVGISRMLVFRETQDMNKMCETVDYIP